jgi:hypothetical protein
MQAFYNARRRLAFIQVGSTADMTGIYLPDRTKNWINGVGLGVWVSGAVWLGIHYLARPQDTLGLPGNSAETWSLKVHGAFAFLAIWGGGFLWGFHIIKAWPREQHRWSGGTLITVSLLLILSGYLLYYVGDERSRQFISLVHWILGLGLPIVYLTHRLTKRTSGTFGDSSAAADSDRMTK